MSVWNFWTGESDLSGSGLDLGVYIVAAVPGVHTPTLNAGFLTKL
jgi:hypothetical protein